MLTIAENIRRDILKGFTRSDLLFSLCATTYERVKRNPTFFSFRLFIIWHSGKKFRFYNGLDISWNMMSSLYGGQRKGSQFMTSNLRWDSNQGIIVDVER